MGRIRPPVLRASRESLIILRTRARCPGSTEERRVAFVACPLHRTTPLSSPDLAGGVETFSTPAGRLSAQAPHHALGRWGRRGDHRRGSESSGSAAGSAQLSNEGRVGTPRWFARIGSPKPMGALKGGVAR